MNDGCKKLTEHSNREKNKKLKSFKEYGIEVDRELLRKYREERHGYSNYE